MPQWLKTPSAARTRVVIGSFILLSLIFFYIVMGESEDMQGSTHTKKPKVETSLSTVSPEERWVNRVEKKTEAAKQEVEQLKMQSALNEQRMAAMEKLLPSILGGEKEEGKQKPSSPYASVQSRPAEQPSVSSTSPFASSVGEQSTAIEVPKIFQSSIAPTALLGSEIKPPKNIDTYIPAGTHAKGILISGLTAYTGTNSSSDPEPLKIRLLDYGVIARGFKGDIKDAVLIGSCYGEISSERARCRLHTLTLEEKNGEIIETPVEGWIMGEDGRSGIRGEVIDRAGEVARSALLSGILGGMGSFLSKQAQNNTFPTTPFGQTNALKGKELVESAGTSGASNALERLAEYTIKRAEKMEPVIVVDAGRRVDVLFKQGFDLSGTSVRDEYQRVGSSSRESKAKKLVHQQGIQSGETL